MMTLIKRYWVVIIFVICIAVFFISRCNKPSDKEIVKQSNIITQSFQSEFGWGYNILINDTILIHQDIVPGAPGNHGFETEAQALAVGRLVMDKIKKKKGIPTVYPKELDSLGIK